MNGFAISSQAASGQGHGGDDADHLYRRGANCDGGSVQGEDLSQFDPCGLWPVQGTEGVGGTQSQDRGLQADGAGSGGAHPCPHGSRRARPGLGQSGLFGARLLHTRHQGPVRDHAPGQRPYTRDGGRVGDPKEPPSGTKAGRPALRPARRPQGPRALSRDPLWKEGAGGRRDLRPLSGCRPHPRVRLRGAVGGRWRQQLETPLFGGSGKEESAHRPGSSARRGRSGAPAGIHVRRSPPQVPGGDPARAPLRHKRCGQGAGQGGDP